MIMEAAKCTGELAGAAKREPGVAEKETDLSEIARREAWPIDAIKTAEQASNASEQANEAAK